MGRSSIFHLHPPTQSLQATVPNGELQRSISSPAGVFPFLHPTTAHLHVDSRTLEWYSRDHRKGRHALEREQRRRIATLIGIQWWNISWWAASVISQRHHLPHSNNELVIYVRFCGMGSQWILRLSALVECHWKRRGCRWMDSFCRRNVIRNWFICPDS